MTALIFACILFVVGYLAGLLGALTGLGGGFIITPVLVLLFKVDIHYAMGASLIAVIVTSTSGSAAYLKDFVNLRIGMFLETAAVTGALIGALLVAKIPTHLIAIIFGVVLLVSAYLTVRHKEDLEPIPTSHPWAIELQLDGNYLSGQGIKPYRVQHVPLAWSVMGCAGVLSGLLGIGSGVLKVMAMDQIMHLPYKVSTTTSNFMIGMTAAVSAGIYFAHGYINPSLSFPIILGIIPGVMTGSKILVKASTRFLRILFSCVIAILACQMIYKGVVGEL